MKGPSLSRSFRPVWLQFKVLTRGWHKHPVQQLTRVRTNSLKILPTKYKIRLPANCAQVNCLISFKYELDRPSSLRTSAQITWIRLGCWDAQSLCVSLPSDQIKLVTDVRRRGWSQCPVCWPVCSWLSKTRPSPSQSVMSGFEIIHEKNTQHMFTRVSSFSDFFEDWARTMQ